MCENTTYKQENSSLGAKRPGRDVFLFLYIHVLLYMYIVYVYIYVFIVYVYLSPDLVGGPVSQYVWQFDFVMEILTL